VNQVVTITAADFKMLIELAQAGFQMGIHASQAEYEKVQELATLVE